MDREQLQKILTRQIAPDAARTVQLPGLGEEIAIRRLTPGEKMQASAASFHKDEGERQARSIAGGLRYSAVDNRGKHLFATFGEALSFLAVLNDDDFAELGKTMNELFADEDEIVDQDQAKNF